MMTDNEYAVCLYREAFRTQPEDIGVPVSEILTDLEKLKKRQRQTLESRLRHGNNYKQVAEEIGVSVSWVRKLEMAALLRLRYLFHLRIEKARAARARKSQAAQQAQSTQATQAAQAARKVWDSRIPS